MSKSLEETRRILEYIDRLMAENPGMSYDDAWAKAKRANFKQPEYDDPQSRIRAVQGWIRCKMSGNAFLTYDEAWEMAKRSKELGGIFLAMESKPEQAANPPASPFDAARRAESISRDAKKRETAPPEDLPSPAITGDPIYRW